MRTTALAVAVVGIALVVAGVSLLIAVRRSEIDRIQAGATARADDIVAAIDRGLAPRDLALDEGEDRFIQIVADGRVVAASRTISTSEPLTDRVGTGVRVPGAGDLDDEWIVVERDTAGGEISVVVGRELDRAHETVSSLAALLLTGIPLLVLIVGGTTWFVAGRALAPVDAIRREADEIGAADLDRRVPEPAGDDEVSRLAATVNRMLERLEDGQARQRRFVSDASHELRSPVTVLHQHAEFAREHPDRTSLEQLADAVLAESERLADLVENLIVLARADEGWPADRRSLVDVDDLVLDAATRVRPDLAVDLTGVSGAQVRGDRRLVGRAIRNVVDNAVAHADSRITIALDEREGEVVLVIDDDGPGVPPDDRDRVFERFVRLDEARDRNGGGTGLGLAIVRSVVDAHGGSVTLDAAPAGGARVVLRLPSSGHGDGAGHEPPGSDVSAASTSARRGPP